MNGSKALARESLNLQLKRRQSNLDKLMFVSRSVKTDQCCGSCEDPVLEWRRPGGSVSAVMRQG